MVAEFLWPLFTLTLLEIVLGIDNIIFLSILVQKLPLHRRAIARIVGLSLAMIFRIGLLLSLSWLLKLTSPLFSIFSRAFSGRDIILLLGGLFLIAKSTFEIHGSLEGHAGQTSESHAGQAMFARIILQIVMIDIIFSLDSVITAVGLTSQKLIMILAVVISIVIMMIFSKSISDFVENHPTIKMLALSFLILIGVTLVGESFHFHIPKGYVYFAMAFSVMVELLNMKLFRSTHKPVALQKRIQEHQP